MRDTHSFLAETVGVPEEHVEFRTAGFNHQCFVYVFRDQTTGEDLEAKQKAERAEQREAAGGAE